MKIIIFGLGNFGSSLGSILTDLGHEVLGVDSNLHKVENHRSKITNTICLDATDAFALATLPLKEADVVIVAIGDDFGGSVMITALLKQKAVKRLITRSTSPVHESVFIALGVDEILHPELEAANRLARKLVTPGLVDAYEIGKEHQLLEIVVPKRYVGARVVELNIKERYNLNLVTILKPNYKEGTHEVQFDKATCVDFVYQGTTLDATDVLVLFGKRSNLKKFLGE